MGGWSARTTQESRRAKKKVTLDESGKVRLLNEFRAALKENNQELAKEKLSLSYHRRNNFFVQLLLDQFFESLESNQVQAESALSSIRDIAQLEQEISGDQFTLDLYQFLRSASPEKLAKTKAARAKYIQAQRHYDDLQTAEAQTEAVRLLTEATAEFDQLDDIYQSLLSQHFKMLLLAFSDGNLSLAISNKLESEARTRKYFALLLRTKTHQQILVGYKPKNRLDELREINVLNSQVNDLNAHYLLILESSKGQSGFEFLVQGIELVTNKKLENKDRQNIYENLTDELLSPKLSFQMAAIESGYERALIASSVNIRLVSAQGWRKIGENYSRIGDFSKAQE